MLGLLVAMMLSSATGWLVASGEASVKRHEGGRSAVVGRLDYALMP